MELRKINDSNRVDGHRNTISSFNDRRSSVNKTDKTDNQAGNRVYRVLTIFYNKAVMYRGFGLYLKVSPLWGAR